MIVSFTCPVKSAILSPPTEFAPAAATVSKKLVKTLRDMKKVVYLCNGLSNHPEPNSGFSPKAQEIERRF